MTIRAAWLCCIQGLGFKAVLVILSVALIQCGARADEATSGFLQRTCEGQRYAVFVPSSPPPEKGYPLILFLHGAGERGTDGRRQTGVGIGPAIRQRDESFPGIVVFPQADFADGPILETWRAGEPEGDLARAILSDVERQWPVDPARRAITGWSMGSYGALSLSADDPEQFCRVLAVSGGGEPQWGPALSKLPVWLVHGAQDRIVPASESRAMTAAVPQPHEHLVYSEIPKAGHDVWRSVYDNEAVLDWLLSADVTPPPVGTISAPPPPDESTADEAAPLTPALVISRAIALRLGNDALQTLAAGVPEALGKEGIGGKLPPVEDRVEFDGQNYEVRFDEMSYRGRLHRAVLEGRGIGQLRLAFALKDLEVCIGAIEVTGRSDGVAVGDVRVIIGHRQPVWMNLDVRPAATGAGSLRLDLLEADFAIGDHNWYVEEPDEDEDIEIRGEAFTAEAVTVAVVGGIYLRRHIIEEKILGAADEILRQVEQRADFDRLGGLVTALWPLPVYKPRVQVRLEEAATDENGISLVFGCVVDDPGATPPQNVPHLAASIPPASEIEPITGLRAAVAVDIIQHLSAMLAGTDAMSLYTADVPGRPFHELDDVEGMSQSLAADLPGGYSDVRARLSLTEPFGYTPLPGMTLTGANPEASSVRMAIEVPRLSLTVFGKSTDPPADWVRVAESELTIRQPLRLEATPRLDGPTTLSVAWEEESAIDLTESGAPESGEDDLLARFRLGWERWSASQQISAEPEDLAVGTSLLRLDRFAWQGEALTAEFLPAATVLLNRTDRPVEYCARNRYSRWSRPLTLPPHSRHIFRSGVPIQVRDADVWSRDGEALLPGVHDWTTPWGAAGRHWTNRQPTPIRTPGTADHSRLRTRKSSERQIMR